MEIGHEMKSVKMLKSKGKDELQNTLLMYIDYGLTNKQIKNKTGLEFKDIEYFRTGNKIYRNALYDKSKSRTVTIVIPAYNSEDYLENTVLNCLKQTFKNFEIIIVNDGSSDKTESIAMGLVDCYENVWLVNKLNGGLSSARNTGAALATGEYIFYIDSDDTMDVATLSDLVTMGWKTGSDIVIGGYDLQYGNSYRKPGIWMQELFAKRLEKVQLEEHPELLQSAIACGKLYRTDFYKANNLQFTSGILYEDQPFTSNAYKLAKNGIDLNGRAYLHWLQRDSSISHQITLVDLAARIHSAKLTLENFEKSSVIEQARLIQYMNHDFKNSIRHFGTISTEYDELIFSGFSNFLHMLLPENKVDIDPIMEVVYHYIENKDAEKLYNFIKETALSIDRIKVINKNGLGFIDWTPFSFIDTKMHSSNQILNEVINPTAELTKLSRESKSINLHFRTHFTQLDPHEFEYKVQVRLTQCEKIETELVIDASKDPRDTTVLREHKEWWVDTSETFYHISIPHDKLPINKSFKIEIILKAGEYTKVIPVEKLRVKHSGRVKAIEISNTAELRIRKVDSIKEKYYFIKKVPKAVMKETYQTKNKVNIIIKSGSRLKMANLVPKINPSKNLEVTIKSLGLNFYKLSIDLLKLSAFEKRFGKWNLNLLNINGNTIFLSNKNGESVLKEKLFFTDTSNSQMDIITKRIVNIKSVQINEYNLISINICVYNSSRTKNKLCVRLSNGVHSVEHEFMMYNNKTTDVKLPLYHKRFGVKELLPVSDYTLEAWIDDKEWFEKQGEAYVVEQNLIKSLPENVYFDNMQKYQINYEPIKNRLKLQLFNDILDEHKGGYGWGNLLMKYKNDNTEVVSGTILMRTYYGESITDNALALTKELLANPEYKFKIYWAVKDSRVIKDIPKGCIPVIMHSKQWFEVLATAETIFENVHQVDYMTKKTGQRIVQNFHGYPYKLMGNEYHEKNNTPQVRINSFERRESDWDYILSPAPYATPLYAKAFNFSGEFLEVGHPRNDILIDEDRESERQEINRQFRKNMNISQNKKVILYAPTFRDYASNSEFTSKRIDFVNYYEISRELGDEYVLLIRGHMMNRRNQDQVISKGNIIDVSDYKEITDLIIASDMAILDYSSLRFDYAQTKKPMIFLVPDLETYESDRPGLLPFVSTAPGYHVEDKGTLINAIKDSDKYQEKFSKELNEFFEKYTSLDDGQATKRMISKIFVSK